MSKIQHNRKKTITRRHLLKAASTTGAASLLPVGLSSALAQSQSTRSDPHFLIYYHIRGGWDVSYSFDTRPQAFTTHEKIQKFGDDQFSYRDFIANGNETFRVGPSVLPIIDYSSYFSAVRGVHMSSNFDGHVQNALAAWTGNPFGGAHFMGNLPRTSIGGPWFVGSSGLDDSISNISSFFTFSTDAMKLILSGSSALKSNPYQHQADQARKIIQDILEIRTNNIFNKDVINISLARYKAALEDSDNLASIIAAPGIAAQSDDDAFEADIRTILNTFKKGLSNHAFYYKAHPFDCHGHQQATEMGIHTRTVMTEIKQLIDILRLTPYSDNGTKSFLDVTTFVVSSEFSRTMRQEHTQVASTGTDHNAFNNLFILGGKGIRGGHIIGASDLDQLQGSNFAETSFNGAHRSQDRNLIKMMGKPYDFQSQQVVNDLNHPRYNGYHFEDYITYVDILNTLLRVMGAGSEHYLLNIQPRGSDFRVLSRILA